MSSRARGSRGTSPHGTAFPRVPHPPGTRGPVAPSPRVRRGLLRVRECGLSGGASCRASAACSADLLCRPAVLVPRQRRCCGRAGSFSSYSQHREQPVQRLCRVPLGERDELLGGHGAVPVGRRPLPEHAEEGRVARSPCAARAGSARRAGRAGRRTSACGPGRPAAGPAACAASSRCADGRERVRGCGPPERSDHSHSAYFAKPSFSQMCRQSAMVTLLPNHWWASSCATSRSEPRAPVDVVGAERWTGPAPRPGRPVPRRRRRPRTRRRGRARRAPRTAASSRLPGEVAGEPRRAGAPGRAAALRDTAEPGVAEQHRSGTCRSGQADQIAGRRRATARTPRWSWRPSSYG